MQIALVPNDDVELVAGSHLRYDTAAEYAVRMADGQSHRCGGESPYLSLRVRCH